MFLQASVILSTGGGCLVPGWGWLVPGGESAPGGGVPGGDPPPPRTAIAVGGTHPTGMHSCYGNVNAEMSM